LRGLSDVVRICLPRTDARLEQSAVLRDMANLAAGTAF
jgi:hypothetical protein